MSNQDRAVPEPAVVRVFSIIGLTLVVLAVIGSLVYMGERNVALPVQPEILTGVLGVAIGYLVPSPLTRR